jgi:lipopolysaccharide export system protein LptA
VTPTPGPAVPVALALALALGFLAAPTVLAQTLDHDSELPIEITADSLEVVQEDQVATFAGNVDAVQGDLVLSADQLRVYYRRSGDDEIGTDGTIRRIEAIGNVFLSSPRETAQGETGVYDVPGRALTLEGSVVLTRDENVIRGDRLEYDLASGRSRVVAAVPGGAGGEPGERVRAIFTPGGGGQAERPRPGAAAAGTGAGGPELAPAPSGAATEPARRAPAPPVPKPAAGE